MKILIVDDDTSILTVINTALKKFGFNTLITKSSKNALSLLLQGGIEILISDLMMPELDGLSLIKLAKKKTPNIKTILMSGSGLTEYEKEESIWDYFLAKPFGITELLEIVQKATGKC